MNLTASQCRAARSLVGWTAGDLSKASGVHSSTLSRFEGGGDVYASTLEKLREALEKAGVLFIAADASGGPGVRLRHE